MPPTVATPNDVGPDPLGLALTDYLHGRKAPDPLQLTDGRQAWEQPVSRFFADEPLTRNDAVALDACTGTVLDIGAGAGRDSLWLQRKGLDVLAIDRSPGAVSVMQARGVRRTRRIDWLAFFDEAPEAFDTVLFKWGFGLAGTPDGLLQLFRAARPMVSAGGHIVGDCRRPPPGEPVPDFSARVRELLGAGVDAGQPFRQRELWLLYGACEGAHFQWLDVSFPAFEALAASEGWRAQVLEEDSDGYVMSLRGTW